MVRTSWSGPDGLGPDGLGLDGLGPGWLGVVTVVVTSGTDGMMVEETIVCVVTVIRPCSRQQSVRIYRSVWCLRCDDVTLE